MRMYTLKKDKVIQLEHGVRMRIPAGKIVNEIQPEDSPGEGYLWVTLPGTLLEVWVRRRDLNECPRGPAPGSQT